MTVGAVVLEVRLNPDGSNPLVPPDDFLGWPVLVELESEPADVGRGLIEATARLLHALWDAGLGAVAACDFEDELPWAGGIRRPGRQVRDQYNVDT